MENGRYTLNSVQAIQKWWEERILPNEVRTPQSRYDRMMMEVDEVQEAMDAFDGTPERGRELALEMIDVFIIGMGLIDSLGYDVENLFEEKMAINHVKYNVVANGQLRENGMLPHEAIVYQKEVWNNGKR